MTLRVSFLMMTTSAQTSISAQTTALAQTTASAWKSTLTHMTASIQMSTSVQMPNRGPDASKIPQLKYHSPVAPDVRRVLHNCNTALAWCLEPWTHWPNRGNTPPKAIPIALLSLPWPPPYWILKDFFDAGLRPLCSDLDLVCLRFRWQILCVVVIKLVLLQSRILHLV